MWMATRVSLALSRLDYVERDEINIDSGTLR